MIKINREVTTMGWKKEIETSYNYKEELMEVLKAKGLKISANRFNGVELNVFDNGGEITISIPNFRKVYINLPFELCIIMTDIAYLEMIYKMLDKFIERLKKVTECINDF